MCKYILYNNFTTCFTNFVLMIKCISTLLLITFVIIQTEVCNNYLCKELSLGFILICYFTNSINIWACNSQLQIDYDIVSGKNVILKRQNMVLHNSKLNLFQGICQPDNRQILKLDNFCYKMVPKNKCC
jgi:hypothetical protein